MPSFSASVKSKIRRLRAYWVSRQERLNARQEANMLRQLSLMMETGFQFFDGLHLLGETMEGAPGKLCSEVADDVREGHSLSGAFVKRSHRLSRVTPYLVKAGEDSGQLAPTLKMAAHWAEVSDGLLAKVKAALVYPVFVLLVNMCLAAAMLIYILPAFQPLFDGEDLPLVTSVVLQISQLVQSPVLWLVLGLLAIEALLFAAKPGAAAQIYSWCLYIPGLSSLLRTAARARFAGVIAITTKSGLSIVNALHLAAQSSGDTDFIELDFKLQEDIRNGQSMGIHFEVNRDVYGPILTQGMLMCQETGEIEQVTRAMTEFFQTETELQADRFKALLEPMLMIFVAVTTATILLAIYMPLAKFVENLMS